MLCCRGVAPEPNRQVGNNADANGSAGKDKAVGVGRGVRPVGKERGGSSLLKDGASLSRWPTFLERGREAT